MNATPRERAIRDILLSLIAERRRLEREAAGHHALEANRLAIAYWQQELTARPADNAAA
jgi:hypothetical protein